MAPETAPRPRRSVRARRAAKDAVRAALRTAGWELRRHEGPAGSYDHVPDLDAADIALYEAVRPYTLTPIERVAALRAATRYIVEAGIPGAVVECGVWRGGSMMVVAATLVELAATDRDLYLFDTFEAMPPPGPRDLLPDGRNASATYEDDLVRSEHAFIPVDDIRARLVELGYPVERLQFVRGMVEETLPEAAPDEVALLRLDTDWYGSTLHELQVLAPRVAVDGVILVDDYGHFRGARDAVDEYFRSHDAPVLLNRIDYAARLVTVTADLRARLQR